MSENAEGARDENAVPEAPTATREELAAQVAELEETVQTLSNLLSALSARMLRNVDDLRDEVRRRVVYADLQPIQKDMERIRARIDDIVDEVGYGEALDIAKVPPTILEAAYQAILDDVVSELKKARGVHDAEQHILHSLEQLRLKTSGSDLFLYRPHRLHVGVAKAIEKGLASARQVQMTYEELLRHLALEARGLPLLLLMTSRFPITGSNLELGRIREAELRAAAEVLGVREVSFLDYWDKDLDRAAHDDVIGRIVEHLRRIRPHVIVTFPPDGAYGHPDHIAVSQFVSAAVVAAADPTYRPGGDARAHRVSKLYFMTWSAAKWAIYQAAFKTLVSRVDGVERQAAPWPDWAITTCIDTMAHWPTVWRAVRCHESQMATYGRLAELSEDDHRRLWGTQEFYRAMSLVNGGRARENDLFAGLR